MNQLISSRFQLQAALLWTTANVFQDKWTCKILYDTQFLLMMLLEVLCFLIGNLARNFDTQLFSVQNAKYAVHSGALGKRIVSWSFHVWLFSEESACLLWIVSTWINSHLAYWHMIQINIRLTAEPMSAKTKLDFCFIRLVLCVKRKNKQNNCLVSLNC